MKNMMSYKEMKKASDDMLVMSYMNGNDAAVNELFMRYDKQMLRQIDKYLREEDASEDMKQDLMLKVMSNLKEGKYTMNGKFGGWLMTVCANAAKDLLRTMKNKKYVSLDHKDEDCEIQITYEDIDGYDDSEEVKERKMEFDFNMDHLFDYIEQLKEEQREIVMARLEDISFKEYATAKGMSVNTALGRMKYATDNLRKMMQAAA